MKQAPNPIATLARNRRAEWVAIGVLVAPLAGLPACGQESALNPAIWSTGKALPLPTDEAAPDGEHEPVVVVRADGVVVFEGAEVSGEDLARKLRASAGASERVSASRVYIRADDAAEYSDVIRVIALVRDAGFPNIALVTEPAAPNAQP